MKSIDSHKDLIVWRKALSLASKVYAATRQLPVEEDHGLTLELRRAAAAIPSSIAEGLARHNRTEFVQQLQLARGRLSELETRFLIALEQNLLVAADLSLRDIEEVSLLLDDLMRRLSCSRRDAHALACSPHLQASATASRAPAQDASAETLHHSLPSTSLGSKTYLMS